MYPLLKPRSLRDVLLYAMSTGGTYDAHELNQKASSFYRECSKQALYKELRALESEGIIFKIGTRYGISLSWILNSLEHLDKIFDNCVSAQSVEAILPRAGEKRSWVFRDFRRTDDFLMNAILLLFRESTSKNMYAWIPHPWFEIVHPAKDAVFRNALRVTGSYISMIIGGDSFLYRYCSDSWDKDVYKTAMAKGPFDAVRHQWFFVIEDLLITVDTEKSRAERLDYLFETVTEVGSDEFKAFLQVLDQPVKTKITIERATQKTNRTMKEFSEYFES